MTVSVETAGRLPKAGRVARVARTSGATDQIVELTPRERQVQIDRFFEEKCLTSPGFSERSVGNALIICWKEPGPGDIFRFNDLVQDPLIKGRGVNGKIDVCRAEARCLYLVAPSRDVLKELLWKHHIVPSAV